MSRDTVQRKRATCYKLIFMGLVWSGFVFLLEHLATSEGQAIDYSQSPGTQYMVWLVKGGGLLVALLGGLLLVRTYRKAS